MPTTPNFGLPYSTLSDPPNGAQQQQQLATATDAALTNLETRFTTRATGVRLERQGSNQPIPGGQDVPLNFDTAVYSATNINVNADMDTVTVVEDGVYIITSSLRVLNEPDGFLELGSSNRSFYLAQESAGSNSDMAASTVAPLSQGEAIQALVFLFSGGDAAVQASRLPHLSVFKIGDL